MATLSPQPAWQSNHRRSCRLSPRGRAALGRSALRRRRQTTGGSQRQPEFDVGVHHPRNAGAASPLLELDEAVFFATGRGVDLVALDDALNELAKIDPKQAQIVELRFYTGLKVEEISELLGISDSTVKREWRIAKAWLYDRLGE